MTETTTTQAATIYAKSWTDRNGRTRYYLNDWAQALFGFEVSYYKTGNISSCSVGSNANGRRVLAVKVWLDEAGEVHVDYNSSVYTTAEIIEAVKAATIKYV